MRVSEIPTSLDLHTHILPKMDDGSKSCAESVLMLERMKEQKIELVFATPHFYASRQSPDEFLTQRDASWSRLKQEPVCREIEIRLGAEVQYYGGISRLDEPERFCVEGTDLFLLEMPFMPWSDRILSEVQLLSENPSLRIMIAHIERYIPIQSRRSMQALMNMDVLFQCNAEYFLSLRTRRKALRMLRQGQIQAIGSDCHNLKTRAPNVGEALTIVQKRIGSSFLQEFLQNERELLRKGDKWV